jgi:CHASE2 domain-containing sensor protein
MKRSFGSVLQAASRRVARRLRNRFYVFVAVLFSLVAIFESAVFQFAEDMKQRTFDAMVKHRFHMPRVDPRIVVVNVDEPSLAAMAKEYGRWPWPRQVFGEFLEYLETQRPAAVVFDILFSDPDVFNADSDAYFDAAVAATDNTWFPLLRLDPAIDLHSQIRLAQIPGIRAGASAQDRSIAVVLPYVPAALASGRLGTHNLYPDKDGIARRYRVVHEESGYYLYSLPSRIGAALGAPASAEADILLNWRGPAFSYHYVSFKDVYDDFLAKQKKRPASEFRDKIVIIGSTAPSLFDIKPTPMDKQFPGVEVLATAIDNLLHDDHLRIPLGRSAILGITLLILWSTAYAFYRAFPQDIVDKVFLVTQIGLLGVSYLVLNYSNYYVSLAGPVTIGLVYFAFARLYALASDRALEANFISQIEEREGDTQMRVLVARVLRGDEPAPAAWLDRLRRELLLGAVGSRGVDALSGRQRGMWRLYQSVLVLNWLHPRDDLAAVQRVAEDITRVRELIERRVARLSGASLQFGEQSGLIRSHAEASAQGAAIVAAALGQCVSGVFQGETGS